ncbi:hypothetical protein NEMIN01_1844 [Nematocida minor]|uniref:uncharacterized protein n=1 Tax=Nematocida minor TaxID=1912983 RepID=UPI002220EA43|nr:uncharacterized protein NEMIN01_1844 [Nematocida minor]KAI5192151.1 hypothetical protein NEMIN01_1844 [Nematocida minor]
MENIILHKTKICECSNGLLSNGFILTDNAVYPADSPCAPVTDRIEEYEGPVGFYASQDGETFKVATASGHILRAEKKDRYRWECAGEMDETVLGMFFNQNSGNILIFTKKEILLLDKYFDLVRKEEYKAEIQTVLEKEETPRITAEWSPDGKYILVCMGTIISVFAYNLEFIADTLVVCNKIMNSRLMQTKKFLMNESAYVDSVKRVSVPDDTCIATEDTLQKNSVVFEKRSDYKLASWHDRFSLIYAVTHDNSIHILERNALKYKEVYHVRECDKKEENMEENNIHFIRSRKDCLYIVNQEKQRHYLKVYYIKNNCIYLKINQDLSDICTKSVDCVRDVVVTSQYDIKIVTNNEIVELSQKACVNRTESDVIDIDGSRVIMYNLLKCPIPPPLYTRQIKLEGVPSHLSAHSNGYISYTVKKKKYSLMINTENNGTVEERVNSLSLGMKTTEIPSVVDRMEMLIKDRKAYLTLNNTTLKIKIGGKESKIENVTSMAPVCTDAHYLLASIKSQAWTEVYKISLNSTTDEITQERVAKTGKESRIVFASKMSVIMMDTYGMLETFYPAFMLEHQVDIFIKKRDIASAVALAKKHGLSIARFLDAISCELESGRIQPRTLFEIVKLLFNEDESSGWMIDKIENYAVQQILESLQSENANPNSSVFAWCSIAVEVYLYKKKPELIVLLAERFTKKEEISPNAFFLLGEHEIARKIIEKCIGAISSDVLLQCALNRYAYTLCYIILLCTDTPQDVTNDVLLVDGSENINPFNMEEEMERRLKIARVAKDKKKQTIYLIKKYIVNTLAPQDPSSAVWDQQIKELKLSIEKEYIRDFYQYLLDADLCTDSDWTFGDDTNTIKSVAESLLMQSGDSLSKEGDNEDALNCYLKAGPSSAEKVRSLRMKLGKWEDLFMAPEMRTAENIQKMEEVLLSQKNVRAAALLNVRYGVLAKGIKYLIEIEDYNRVLEIAEKENMENEIQFTIKSLTQKIKSYANSVQSTIEKYKENSARLQTVRERKDRERAEILDGMFADDDCETVYTRSFITNTFLSGSQSTNTKKKRRSSKLRNTVGGRYEEEYVQYVLSELILQARSQTEHVMKIEEIAENIRTKYELSHRTDLCAILGEFKNEKSVYDKELCVFLELFTRTKETDFASLNTEDDPLYDPERPFIPEPESGVIPDYLKR